MPSAYATDLVLTPVDIPCGKTKSVIEALTEAGERPQYVGSVVNSEGFLQVVWTSNDGTSTVTHSKGDLMCVVSMSTNFRKTPRRPNS